ncbi:MAG: tetratricopeptide repeat protein [Candidatus Symbiothrix sp.]|jgi:tetratricopeptide (TPR) repeat protein|nr:tetratricopeptide repeat protein [Candidatus Symbiothrix sp.]
MKMNSKKVLGLAIAVFFSVTGVFAGSNEKGIDLYRAELYEAAKYFFLQQRNQTPQEQAENQYYLGQTYYQLQKPDSAAYYYAKAIETAPEYPFGYIGEGELTLKKGDTKGADALFKKAIGFAKKDASVQTTIAEVYANAGLYPQAEEALEKAQKVNKKYSGIYLVKGDIALKTGNRDQAYGWYDQAIYFDKNDKASYLKLARGYKDNNETVALDYLDKLVAIDPDYIPAYALIGDINRDNGMYLQALKAYEKFISIPGVPVLQHERYAQLLYFTDQYEKSLQQIDYVLQQDPANPVMHRIQAYDNFKLDNSALALQQLGQFLQDNPADKHIYLDYTTYGRLLLKEKQSAAAVDAFQKAAALDPTKSEVYKELATAYEKANNYPEAVKQYDKYFEVEQTPVVFDYFYYGQNNYSAASKYIDPAYLATVTSPEQKQLDNEAFQGFINKGDGAFSEVISRSPDSYLGYIWRAHLHALVDAKSQEVKGAAMQGDAKPYYEKALEVMVNNNADGKRNNDILDAYRYLGSYYLLLDDKANAGDYYKKILEIDPENTDAKTVLTTLKIKY